MEFIWLKSTKESFENIQSQYFSYSETIEYKLQLLERIEDKIQTLGTSIKADKPEWKGSYKILVDRFVIYYSFSEDKETCYIEYFKHSSQLD
jgi:mRNA-degrading endonuclease RelE of RelBE toxin-antitoxin system